MEADGPTAEQECQEVWHAHGLSQSDHVEHDLMDRLSNGRFREIRYLIQEALGEEEAKRVVMYMDRQLAGLS